MKLHLGCGKKRIKGYVNCDISKEVNPDKVLDLEKNPLPFKDNSIDEILAEHVLEHINNFIPLMHDLRRICKNGTIIKIKVPFYSSWGQYNDPTHVRFFTPFTFNYFKVNKYSHEVNCNEDMFIIKKVKINYSVGTARSLNKIFNPLINLNHKIYCRFFAWIFPSSEIEYELIVKK
jgi:predicted SAM-dependent methyltransferase